MTPRSIRRAAERKAMKLARKAERISLEAQTPPAGAVPISGARLPANRANAVDEAGILSEPKTQKRFSTGPTTPEGKAKVSSAQGDFQPVVRGSMWGAVKTALTGRTVLLPTDDVAEYQRHLALYEKEFKPVGLEESELVQSLAEISWRLRRISALEMAIYAQGRIEFANHFADQEDPPVRRSLIELHTHLVYERQLRNLQLQESRLVRRREKESAELRRLQQERAQKEKRALESAAQLYVAADTKPFDPAVHGFEFSIAEVESHLQGVRGGDTPGQQRSEEVNPERTAYRAA
jgi:hypothetical protein